IVSKDTFFRISAPISFYISSILSIYNICLLHLSEGRLTPNTHLKENGKPFCGYSFARISSSFHLFLT
ncbi:MAG: hypothetical protein KAT65_05055, partial [Methanophagales archaeon]|nr:hypothetical protein [Methanophagales archaeon]